MQYGYKLSADGFGPNELVRQARLVGYDHVVLMNNGPDSDGFMDFFARELRPQLGG